MALLAGLLLCSAQTLESARAGLALCARVIIPSLFPFFVLSSLMNAMGIPARLGRSAAPVMSALFGVSGSGAAAFILGAAGAGIFGSAEIGLKLYAAHVLAAAAVGILMRRRGNSKAIMATPPAVPERSFSSALPDAVRASVNTVLTVCGFVVTFTVLTGILDAVGFFPAVIGRAAVLTDQGLHFSRALLTGLLELGSGIGAMEGLAPNAKNLALCAFLIGWGGVSVHFQTAAVIAGTGMKTARHTAGRLLCGIFSAALMLLFSRL